MSPSRATWSTPSSRRLTTCALARSSPPLPQNQYSLFTPLPRLLFANGITHVTVVGLALDYCVRASVLDAVKFGLAVTVVRAGVRAVSPEEEARFFADFERKGVRVV